MIAYLKQQWSRKIAIGLLFWSVGTLIAMTTIKATFAEWASFTQWIAALLFAANVGEKVFKKPGNILNGVEDERTDK